MPITLGFAASAFIGGLIGYTLGHIGYTKNTDAPAITTTVIAPTTPGPASPTPTNGKTGTTLTLTGNSAGEKENVTVVKVVDPATSTDQYVQPDQGKHYVVVQVRLTNTGTAAYADSPTNGAHLIDTQGQQYNAEWIGATAVGQSFSGQVKIAPSASALGAIIFAVPDGTKPAAFQFALDSGFGRQTGQWQLN
jgi:hypothetical protein